MKQTAEQMMQVATARGTANDSKVSNTIVAKSGNVQTEKTFHQKELLKKIADPANADYEGAKLLGQARARAFIKSATDTQDPDHEETFKVFNTVHNLSADTVEKHFIDQTCHEMSAFPYELENPTYEKHLLERRKPKNDISPIKQKFYDNFVAEMRKKWDKVGYKGDKKFVNEYCLKYGLGVANNLHPDPFEEKM